MSKPTFQPIRKLLIANRGEIAVRIIKAARALGIGTVAVYSEADAQSPHVELADEAWAIGTSAAADSYLRIDKLIEVARASGANAIHPGYGFVSENPSLPMACAEAGLVLVGPSAQAMADMADKAQAKKIAHQAGLPCIPGFNQEAASLDELIAAANDIGYPVMVKALAGGGGRGMRLVADAAQLPVAIHSAQQEAKNAFGDDRIMLEKAVVRPRHVEIQVLADCHGHAIHLGERDCSVQRRHQKIVEEAPSPAVDKALRARMGEAALKLVEATQYVGAGTVEFLLDENGNFYFIEMNTRLQVEHGVTELITGIDLVQWQLRIASGQALTVQQADVKFNGHAIQARLCAEDPAQDFLPQTGKVLAWQPASGDAIRVDHALKSGLEVSPWYDSMVAKVMAVGADRLSACNLLGYALTNTTLVGLPHNGTYLKNIVGHSDFRAGEFSTSFVGEHNEALLAATTSNNLLEGGLLRASLASLLAFGLGRAVLSSPWPTDLIGRANTASIQRPFKLEAMKQTAQLTLACERVNNELGAVVSFPDKPTKENPNAQIREPIGLSKVSLSPLAEVTNAIAIRFEMEGQPVAATAYFTDDGAWVKLAGSVNAIHFTDASLLSEAGAANNAFVAQVKSPMSGKILEVAVTQGQQVNAGDLLVSLEAMKMEHRQTAKHDAKVDEILVAPGDQMNQGQVMVILSPLTGQTQE